MKFKQVKGTVLRKVTNFSSVLLITFLPMLCASQSFVECGQNLKKSYITIEDRLHDKKISMATADSLQQVNFATFDNCALGRTLPDFTFTSKSGKIYTKDSLKNKVVMLNIWSVRCEPCIAEIPVLNKIAKRYQENDRFLLLSLVRETQDDFNNIFNGGITNLTGKVTSKRTIDFDIVLNAKKIIKEQFQLIEAYPTTFFLDKEGRIYKRAFGGLGDPKDAEKLEVKYRTIIESHLKD